MNRSNKTGSIHNNFDFFREIIAKTADNIIMINHAKKDKLNVLKLEYEQLRCSHDDLLKLISESELPEMVYNSNAIEIHPLLSKRPKKFFWSRRLCATFRCVRPTRLPT